MRTIFTTFLALVCLCVDALAAEPPYIRNPFDTNPLSPNSDFTINATRTTIGLSTQPTVFDLIVTNSVSVIGTGTGSGQVLYGYPVNDFVATNSTANSNQTVNFNEGTREIYLTNNISITNFTGMLVGQNANVLWRVIPIGMNRNVVWPTAGASSFGMRFDTNAGSVLWPTFTNGMQYLLSFSGWNTNIVVTVSAFSYQ